MVFHHGFQYQEKVTITWVEISLQEKSGSFLQLCRETGGHYETTF